jgi:hypothetical protein
MQFTRSIFPGGRRRRPAPVVLCAALVAAITLVIAQGAQAVTAWQVTTVDGSGGVNVGQYSSLVLDRAGLPVISYYEAYDIANPGPTGNLKLARCGDATCTPANVSIQTVDSKGNVGQFTSLALDAAGNPVMSYQTPSNDLKVVHCNDANCAGGDESMHVLLDSVDSVGQYNSLVLDGSGNPVISYYDATNGNLKVVHCNDANCAGDNESIEVVDSAGNVGLYTSLALDGAGNPVISYYEANDAANPDTGNLKLAHCNDANCAGGDESIQKVDSLGNVGQYTSLALDGAGNPVISYYDVSNTNLKLAHCSDANCTPGNVSSQTVDNVGTNGSYNSLALDAAGNPVISYRDATPANLDLKLAQCSDADCTPGQVNILTVDGSDDVGQYTSLALDVGGLPVISYYDVTNGDLKLARLVNDPPPSVTVEQAAGQADPTNGSPIHFTVTFSEAVTGFDGSDVLLSGTTGANTATVTELAPNNGTTYDVAVSGMTSSGTVVVSVPADVATDSGGNGNTASTSSDNSVTWSKPTNAPVASNQTVTTTAGLPITITLTAVDGDGDPLTYTVTAGPQHGTLQGTAPVLIYTPSPGYVGSDQLSFQVSDGQANSNTAVVTIQVVAGPPPEEKKLYLPFIHS